MTDLSPATREELSVPPGDDGTGALPARRGGLTWAAAVAGLIAMLCALTLPFAPVEVNEPTVSWPRDAAAPEPTLLQLTAFRPLAIDVSFSCEAARLAQASGGLVVATTSPDNPVAQQIGLLVSAADDSVRVVGLDRTLLAEPIPAGDCTYAISGRSGGLPSYQFDTPDPLDESAPDLDTLAGPDNARITISRDGVQLASVYDDQLPDVDLLTTSLTAVPAGALSVDVRVDDEFGTSATPLKSSLTWSVVIALAISAVLLVLADRGRDVPERVRRRRFPLPRLVDLVVPAVLVFWMFVAPATDDDGYYAAMARNSTLSGEVGNYYQLYDQNFTPFTWFYYALGWWQDLAGDGPVQQRIPAVVFGLVTWLAIRRITSIALDEWAPDDRRLRVLAHAVLGVAFLAWWVPQDMGVRPETVVAMAGTLTLLTVLAAWRSGRLSLTWLAFLLAGAGFTTHPTGFTLFAPLLAGIPLLWRVVHRPGEPVTTGVRAFAVATGAMIAPVLSFVDGGFRDFVRGQSIFLSLQAQDNWTTEIQRWSFLLSQIPMGNFAKRSAILVCVLALLWFGVVAGVARARRTAIPTPLWYAAASTAIAFASLWATPSKWTHHFGSLAGVGPVFLALFLVLAVPVTRKALDGARLPMGVVAAAAATFVAMIALVWHGPNSWPYAWMDGTRRPYFPPAISNTQLDSPVIWAAVIVVIGVVLVLLNRGQRRFAALSAVPVMIVVSLVGTTVYTVGTFGLAAAQGVPRDSIWATSFADPAGCGGSTAVQVYDPATAQVLAPLAGAPEPPAPEGFLDNAGYYPGNAPQGAQAAQVWGSLFSQDGLGPELTFGRMTTGWYQLPADLPAGSAVTVIAAGTLSDGNGLTAVYGRGPGDDVQELVGEGGTQYLTDGARNPAWRTFVLTPPEGAEAVRLQALDASGAVHGWVGFSAPALSTAVTLGSYLPAEAPIAVGWQLAFGYPCLQQPRVVDGITQTPEFAVLWGDGALAGIGENTWVPYRGGLFAQIPRTQSVLQLATVTDGGANPYVQVYEFGTALASDSYTVTRSSRVVSGLDTTVPTDPTP